MPDDERDLSAAAHAATVASGADATGDTVSASPGGDAIGATVGAAPAIDATGATVGATLSAAPMGGAAERPASRGGERSPHFIRGRELARGGMGRVVIAEDRRLDRTVALKLLQRVSPTLRTRFEREAHITARLAHPAIVPIYDAGELEDGEPFYAMKLVDGMPLDDAIAKAKDLPARLAILPGAMAVCEALAYAHSKRIIHRDLKPANVLVGKFGETVVIDWGLAKDLRAGSLDGGPPDTIDQRADHDVTLDGQVVGTPSYMPPEQAAGEGVDERADVYALGALLYHVVAGRPPYLGKTAGEILAAVAAGPPRPIAALEPAVPEDLATIIGKAMARAPAARYPTAGELADDLRGFIDGRLVASHRYSGAELLRRWLRRHRTAVAVGAVALGVLAAGGAISVGQIMAREHETRRALAESQLEQGRQLLVDGDPGRAAPYLAAAFAELPDDPVAARLAAAAVRELPRRVGRFAGTAAAFRGDGGELAIGRADGSIELIDPDTGATRRRLPALPGELGAIAQLAYAPDGSRIAVASASGAYVRDARTGAQLAIASPHAATEVRVAPRAGGYRFVFARKDDGAVSLVGSDGAVLAEDRVAAPDKLAVAVDGHAVAATSPDGAVAWSTADLARIRVVPNAAVHYSAMPEADDVLTAGEDGVRRWSGSDAADVGTPLLTAHAVSLAPIGDHVALADERIVHTDTGEVHAMARDSVEAVALIDRTHAITGGFHRVLRVWDLERTALPVLVLDPEVATRTLAVDPTGRRAVSRGALADARVELWDVSHLDGPTRSATSGHRVDGIFADHHDRIAIHVADGATELRSGTLDLIATVGGWPMGFRPSHDELATGENGVITVFSARDGKRLREVVGPDPIWRVASSPSGTVIATASDVHITVRDAAWGATKEIDVPSRDVSSIGVDDRGRVITGHYSGMIRIWDGRTGAVLATATGHTATVSAIDVRGDTFVTNSWDLTTRLWDTPTGALRRVVKRFDRGGYDVQMSPNGQLIASVDGDATIELWDAEQGRLLARSSTTAEATQAEFLDDDHVVVGDVVGGLEVFDVSVRPRTPAEVAGAIEAAGHWQLVGGRAIERR